MYRNTCAWKIGHAETFRNKSSKLLGHFGTNLQNPSDKICRIYIPDEDKVFVQCDQAGAEALIVGYLCRPGNKLRDLFSQGIKPHVYVAMHIFKDHWAVKHPVVYAACGAQIKTLKVLPGWKELAKDIKDDYQKYFIGKKVVHASNYDMGANTLRMAILTESEGKTIVSYKEACGFLDLYHGLFPEIRQWHNEIQQQIKKTRTLYNLFGYPRYFGGPFQPKTFKEGYAFIPQSTVGVLANISYVQEQDYIEANGKDWDLLNNKHDSTLTQCPKDEVEECARVKRKTVEKVLRSPYGEEFQMKSEVSVGMNWGKYDEEKNPEGMKEVEL